MKNDKIEHLKGSIYLFSAFTLAGTSVVAARFVASQLGVFTITVVSLSFAMICLAPFCAKIQISLLLSMSKRQWLMLLLQAIFGIFFFRLFLLQGLLRTSTGEAGILTGATPAITALLALIVLKERLKIRTLVGVVSSIGGILLVQGLLLGNDFSSENFWGNALILCAAASESIFNILSRLHVENQKSPLNPIVQTLLVSGIALTFCVIPALFEHPVSSLLLLGIKEWLALVWYGGVVTALAFICWYSGIRRSSAYAAAAFSGMMPFTSLVLSVILLGESAGWKQWSGGAFIVIGMLLIGKREVENDAIINTTTR